MNELHEEIRQTMLALNQENAQPVVEELQCHLGKLFDMARDELQQRLIEYSWLGPIFDIAEQVEAPYKSVRIDCGDKQPLTVEELKAGGWWCGDMSEECRKALEDLSIRTYEAFWDNDICVSCSYFTDRGGVLRNTVSEHDRDTAGKKQIHRIGNQFFWSDEK